MRLFQEKPKMQTTIFIWFAKEGFFFPFDSHLKGPCFPFIVSLTSQCPTNILNTLRNGPPTRSRSVIELGNTFTK